MARARGGNDITKEMPKKTSVKARLARRFLSFLDEHGGYRSQLEEAATRAAAAEANSLFDRRGRKKKRKRWRGGEEEEDDEWEELEELGSPEGDEDPNKLPEDPYEQIQFYFRTFKQRTRLQIEERLDAYRAFAKNWMHDELHHPARVPLFSGAMLGASVLLWAWRWRGKKVARVARLHGILGKKLEWKNYLHSNIVRGRVLLQHSEEGSGVLGKLSEKANKAEEAALAGMRPYQRRKYERFCKLERCWEWCVVGCLLLAMSVSGVTLGLSLNGLLKGDSNSSNANGMSVVGDLGTVGGEGEELDGHIYSLDGPTDVDGYPIGVKDLAEENYAACLSEAEDNGVEDLTTVCNVDDFLDAAVNGTAAEDGDPPSSPLRSKINALLAGALRVPPVLADYLTALPTQTIAYLSSFLTFLLLLASHYVANAIHKATMQNDPMKHFVLLDKTVVKADGTVAAKRGETEAQRKRRERKMQAERLKAQMAQLALEAKQRVAERRARMEGAEAATREKEEAARKAAEEEDEVVNDHGRQLMMIKMGVPDGAVLNSLAAEGIEGDEAKGIIEKLKAAKARKADEAGQAEEMQAKKLEDEKKAEEDKERIAAERLRMMKNQRGGRSVASSAGGGGDNRSVVSSATVATATSSKKPLAAIGANPATAKSAMLGQIGGGGNLKSAKGAIGANPATAKSAMLGQIGGGGQGNLKSALPEMPAKIAADPAPRPGSATMASGDLPVGATGDRRLDRESKTSVSAATTEDIQSPSAGKPPITSSMQETPIHSDKKENQNTTTVGGVPSRLKLGGGDEEEKKGEEESSNSMARRVSSVSAPPPAMPPISTPVSSTATPSPLNAFAAVPPVPASADAPTGPEAAAKREQQIISTTATTTVGAARKQVSKTTPPKEAAEEGAGDGDDIHRGRDNNSRSSGSSSTPVLVRISFPGDETPLASVPNTAMDALNFRRPTARDILATIAAVENAPDEEEGESEKADLAPSRPNKVAGPVPNAALDALDFRRPTARDIQATIAVVENTPDTGEGENDGVDLAPAWLHSPAFDTALRNSNASWDRRPSSRDVAARIRAVEQFEEVREQQDTEDQQQEPAHQHGAMQHSSQAEEQREANNKQQQLLPQARPRNFRRQADGSLAIIDEGPNTDRTSFQFLHRTSSRPSECNLNTSDDDISELSEPSYLSRESNAFKARSIPQALEISPMMSSTVSAMSPPMSARGKMMTKDGIESYSRAMAETADLDLPAMMHEGPGKTSDASIRSDTVSVKSEEPAVKVESEEEKRRRERAEARVKKMEVIAARREAGEEDDESAVSGIPKRHRMRRKKKASGAQLVAIATEEGSSVSPSDALSEGTPARVETEGERQRKKRAEARAKKLEAMAARRNADKDDDGTTVTGISRRQRIRRKKSMLAAISPEERERNDWKKGIFVSVLNADRARWRTSVYGHVMNAETTLASNAETRRELDKRKATGVRLLEHQRRLGRMAKKFAARADQFHKIRREGEGDDESVTGSVVSSASKLRRRRRGRKSSAAVRRGGLMSIAVGEEPVALTMEEKEKQEREQWCNAVYTNVIQSEQCQWQKKIYSHVIYAEESQKKRLEMETEIAKESAALEARREKERQNELRARKMERIQQIRGAGAMGNIVPHNAGDDQSVASIVSPGRSLRKMMNRRRKAARKSVSAASASASAAPVPVVLTAEEKEKREREQWCNSVYTNVIQAEQCQWKKSVYSRTIHAEDSRNKRLEMEAQIAKERVVLEARREKERQSELRAKKMQMIMRIRGDGGRENIAPDADDDQSVASIMSSSSRSLKKMRNRRKKAARKSMPAMTAPAMPAPIVLTAEEKGKREQGQWCNSVYTNVLRAEQCQWKKSVYSHTIHAEESRNNRLEIEAEIGKAARKSMSVAAGAPLPAPIVLTTEEKEKRDREQWCNSVYTNVIQAEQCQWKKNVYSHTIDAEESQNNRLEMKAQIAKERAALEACREKERQSELRAKKMEKIMRIRGDGGRENIAPEADDDQSVASIASPSGSSLKRMRNRRRKSSRKSMSAVALAATPAPIVLKAGDEEKQERD